VATAADNLSSFVRFTIRQNLGAAVALGDDVATGNL
jgi:hypothetical protein